MSIANTFSFFFLFLIHLLRLTFGGLDEGMLLYVMMVLLRGKVTYVDKAVKYLFICLFIYETKKK